MRAPRRPRVRPPKNPTPGLRQNWLQFTLLVIVNAFVGAMVGTERVLVPLLGERAFGISANAAILSFMVSFGLVKAGANLFAGHLSDRVGRKRVLVAGWLFALPVPALLYWAPSWSWVVAANVLLGANQGLSWSMTVVMKIDLAGSRRRGLAMGLNEAAGYLAVAGAALCSGYLAGAYGDRAALLVLGTASAFLGMLVSVLFVRESRQYAEAASQSSEKPPSFREVFTITSWKNPSLFAVSQAGMLNNLNDGMAWGLFPIYFASQGLSLPSISLLSALYPAVWGFAQLGTGALSDLWGRKLFIVAGMILQGAAILSVAAFDSHTVWLIAAVMLGVGTAMVYPTLLAAVGDVADASWRASAVGVYRLWRDLGYAVGAILSGLIADVAGVQWAIAAVGILTVLSGVLAAGVMRETLSKHALKGRNLAHV